MKRTILLLISALIVFVSTLVITNNYMTNESLTEADRINDLLVQGVRTRMDVNLVVREKSVHSFLSGLLSYKIDKNTNGKLDTTIVISDQEISHFRSYAYTVLGEFMKLNPHIMKAFFIIDPSNYDDLGPHGFVPCIVSGDTTHYDLSRDYDFMHSPSYMYIKTYGDCTWRIPHKGSPYRGKTVVYYVPIYRESGKFFGAFAIDLNLELVRQGLEESLPYDDKNSVIIVINESKDVIISTNQFFNDCKNITDVIHALSKDETFNREKENFQHHDIYDLEGKTYFVYHSSMSKAPWHAITICAKNAIYEKVYKTRNIIILVSIIGMLLMLGCCIVVSRQVRNHLQQRLAVENELNMAAKVQMSMLRGHEFKGKSASLHAFIQPAREAGGDLYDYIEQDGRLIFCIGDVSGKGMSAALFMTQVVSLFRNAVRCSVAPEKILSDMNRILSENNPEMTFCTCIVGIIEGDTLTYCNAGHNHPLLVPANEGEAPYFLHPHSNIALGLMDYFPYQSNTLKLHPSDRIFLYTDGVTEAKNIKHEQYSEARLLATLTEHRHTTDLCTAINDSVILFRGTAPQSDDITILTVESTSAG